MKFSVVQSVRVLAVAGVLGAMSMSAHAQLTTEQDVQTTLKKDGYQQVHDIKFSKDGINAKAVKDGKPVSVIMDTSGKVMQRK